MHKTRHGVYSLRGRRAGYAAPTPPFSSVWRIARETGSAFKTPHTSLPHHPVGGVRTTPLGLLLDAPRRREAAAVGECLIIASGKPKYRDHHRQDRKTQKRSGLTLPLRSLKLDIMSRKSGTAGHSSHASYNVCKPPGLPLRAPFYY